MADPIKPANIQWQADTPFSSTFNDIYYAKQDGAGESHYVFIEGNRLQERFNAFHQDTTPSTFVIGETGFGTGLNFVLAAHLWQQCLGTDTHAQKLIFITTEKYPLTLEDLRKAAANWPAYQITYDRLLECYPHLTKGLHSIQFSENIELWLYIGDAAKSLAHLNTKVDAWFLDGFNPAENKDMWSPVLFEAIAHASKPDTTLATFTAAGFVRRALEEVGFRMQKRKGFGNKREMLIGQFSACSLILPKAMYRHAVHDTTLAKPIRSVIVVGAGLAGATTANSLAKAGLHVTVLEKQSEAAQAASGARQGILYFKPSIDLNPFTQFYIQAYEYAIRTYQTLQQSITTEDTIFDACGLIQLAWQDKELRKHAQLQSSEHYPNSLFRFSDEVSLSKKANTQLAHTGYLMPDSGWVNTQAICLELLKHPNIEIKTHTECTALNKLGAQWQAVTTQGNFKADAVVLCAAHETKHLAQSSYLPLKAIRGQISYVDVKASDARSEQAAPSFNLETVLCGEGYIAPPRASSSETAITYGASFNLHNASSEPDNNDHQANLSRIEAIAPALAKELTQQIKDYPDQLNAKVAFRCTTPDYLPLVGPLGDFEQLIETFAPLRKRADKPVLAFGNYYDGLYVNVAHGSKGLTSTPLCARYITDMMTGRPCILDDRIKPMLWPSRFVFRDLARNKI